MNKTPQIKRRGKGTYADQTHVFKFSASSLRSVVANKSFPLGWVRFTAAMVVVLARELTSVTAPSFRTCVDGLADGSWVHSESTWPRTWNCCCWTAEVPFPVLQRTAMPVGFLIARKQSR